MYAEHEVKDAVHAAVAAVHVASYIPIRPC